MNEEDVIKMGWYGFRRRYLNPNATSEEIEESRRVFNRKYQRQYKRIRRRTVKEFTICFNPKEYALIIMNAGRFKMSISRYVKKSSLAFSPKPKFTSPRARFIDIESNLIELINYVEDDCQHQDIQDDVYVRLKKVPTFKWFI